MAHLQSQELAGRGDLRAVVSKDAEGLNLMVAFVWVDRERRYFICNGGNLDPTTPVFRSRWRQVDDTPNAEPEHVALEIPQPKATHVYYSVCGKIDQSNRTRQDNLDIKKILGTHRWDKRVNLSIFGIELVDTYYVCTMLARPTQQRTRTASLPISPKTSEFNNYTVLLCKCQFHQLLNTSASASTLELLLELRYWESDLRRLWCVRLPSVCPD